MGTIFCLLGKSSTGKDTIYKRLTENRELSLTPIIPYTTRPIRKGEREGVEYHFVTEERYRQLQEAGRVIEERAYNTVHGLWRYFTVAEESVDPKERDYLITAGTLVAFRGIREYYGAENVRSILIDVDDGDRLQRALNRERKQETPKYEEMCRRFLADSEDFSEDKIRETGIDVRIRNDELEQCLADIISYVKNRENTV
jgi:guanylate kinase